MTVTLSSLLPSLSSIKTDVFDNFERKNTNSCRDVRDSTEEIVNHNDIESRRKELYNNVITIFAVLLGINSKSHIKSLISGKTNHKDSIIKKILQYKYLQVSTVKMKNNKNCNQYSITGKGIAYLESLPEYLLLNKIFMKRGSKFTTLDANYLQLTNYLLCIAKKESRAEQEKFRHFMSRYSGLSAQQKYNGIFLYLCPEKISDKFSKLDSEDFIIKMLSNVYIEREGKLVTKKISNHDGFDQIEYCEINKAEYINQKRRLRRLLARKSKNQKQTILCKKIENDIAIFEKKNIEVPANDNGVFLAQNHRGITTIYIDKKYKDIHKCYISKTKENNGCKNEVRNSTIEIFQASITREVNPINKASNFNGSLEIFFNKVNESNIEDIVNKMISCNKIFIKDSYKHDVNFLKQVNFSIKDYINKHTVEYGSMAMRARDVNTDVYRDRFFGATDPLHKQFKVINKKNGKMGYKKYLKNFGKHRINGKLLSFNFGRMFSEVKKYISLYCALEHSKFYVFGAKNKINHRSRKFKMLNSICQITREEAAIVNHKIPITTKLRIKVLLDSLVQKFKDRLDLFFKNIHFIIPATAAFKVAEINHSKKVIALLDAKEDREEIKMHQRYIEKTEKEESVQKLMMKNNQKPLVENKKVENKKVENDNQFAIPENAKQVIIKKFGLENYRSWFSKLSFDGAYFTESKLIFEHIELNFGEIFKKSPLQLRKNNNVIKEYKNF